MGYSEWPVVGGGGSGTVTSVAMTVPSALLAVSGSPITTTGTLAVTLGNRAANLMFAGPATGADAAPSFRAQVIADFPGLTSASVWVGNGSNRPAAVSFSGDISLANTGATAYSGVVPLNKGGTGNAAASANAAFNVLSPMTTAGDIIYGGVSGAGTRLGIGTALQLLRTNAGATAPEWATITAGDFSGPASSVDNAIVRFDGTGGKTGQDSSVFISDVASNIVTISFTDDAVNNSTASNSWFIHPPNKTAGTGDGGLLKLTGGNSSGGLSGKVAVGYGGATDANSVQFGYAGGLTQVLAPKAVSAYAFIGSTTSGMGYSSSALTFDIAGSTNLWIGSNYLQFITSVHSDGTATKDFGAYNGTTLYPFRTAYIGTSVAIGIASGSIFTPNYHLDIRQATAANAVYQQFSITTTTGTASTDGTKVGLDASGNFVINQQEALAINLQIGGTTTQSISSAGLVTIGASGGTQIHVINGATASAGSDAMTLLNGPAGTAGNPDLFLKVNINGTVYVIPAWTPT